MLKAMARTLALTVVFVGLHLGVAQVFAHQILWQQVAISLTWCVGAVGLRWGAKYWKSKSLLLFSRLALTAVTLKVVLLDWSLWGLTLTGLCFEPGSSTLALRSLVQLSLWITWMDFNRDFTSVPNPNRSKVFFAVVTYLLPLVFGLLETHWLCPEGQSHFTENTLALMWWLLVLVRPLSKLHHRHTRQT